jgi:hypothetical protein
MKTLVEHELALLLRLLLRLGNRWRAKAVLHHRLVDDAYDHDGDVDDWPMKSCASQEMSDAFAALMPVAPQMLMGLERRFDDRLEQESSSLVKGRWAL